MFTAVKSYSDMGGLFSCRVVNTCIIQKKEKQYTWGLISLILNPLVVVAAIVGESNILKMYLIIGKSKEIFLKTYQLPEHVARRALGPSSHFSSSTPSYVAYFHRRIHVIPEYCI